MSNTTLVNDIKEGEFKPKQLLMIENVNNYYPINKVTDKAILVECFDGKWIDNGTFIPLWIPISILKLRSVNDSKQNSQFGIHVVDLPEWFIRQNRKRL